MADFDYKNENLQTDDTIASKQYSYTPKYENSRVVAYSKKYVCTSK